MQSPLDQVLVWDLETIPDLPCVARVNGFDEADEAVAREKLGDKFPKLIHRAIVCIGALIAERVEGVCGSSAALEPRTSPTGPRPHDGRECVDRRRSAVELPPAMV